MKDDVIRNLKRDFKVNTIKKEQKAMKDRLEDETSIIRPSDKGSGIVVMDSDKYKDEIEKYLDDCSTYMEIDEKKWFWS